MMDISRFFTDDLIAYTSDLNKPQKVSIATKSDTTMLVGFQNGLDYPTEQHQQDAHPRILSHARKSAFMPTNAAKEKFVQDRQSHGSVTKLVEPSNTTTPETDKLTTPSIDSKNKNDLNIFSRSNHLNLPIDDIDVPTLLFDVPRKLPPCPYHDRAEGHFDDFFLTVPQDSENESEVEDDRVHQEVFPPPPLTFQGSKRIFLKPRFSC